MKELWNKFMTWKHHKYALIGGAALMVVIAIVIAVCVLSGDAPGDPTTPTTEPTGPAAPLASADQMKNVAVEKTSSAGGAITAHPGGRITYKIIITNNNSAAISVNVTDTLPTGTVLVNGCDNENGNQLSWNIKRIEPGKTYTITYTASPNYTIKQVRESKEDIILKNTPAKVMDKTVAAPTKDIWVLETFNATDRRRIEMGIDALVTANLNASNSAGQNFSGPTLISQMYGVGFSTGVQVTGLHRIFALAGSDTVTADELEKTQNRVDMMVPGLYGGTAVPASSDSLYRGARAAIVTIDDLISGDVIYVSKDSTEKYYIVRGATLVEVGTDTVITNIDPTTILPALPSSDRYAVIRPSINLPACYSLNDDEFYNDADKSEYTELEKAIIATAESYLLRGDRTQYTDDVAGKSLYRWETSTRQPEDYTVDQYGYINCAAFTHDVHWATYGYSMQIGSTVLNSTVNLLNNAAAGWNEQTLTGKHESTIYYYHPTGTETDTQKAAIYNTFVSLLRPGDLIANRYANESNGHVMLYVGNGLIIHSMGGSFPSGKTHDSHEATVRWMCVDDLFDYSSDSHMFTKSRFCIVRPQNLTTPKITKNTANRVANMQGVVGEKVSSTAMGKTVNPGDTITYTFYIFNTNKEAKQFTIKDVLSEYVTFVSATDGGICSGSNIVWNITVPASTRTSVSYTVKVKDGVATYSAIDGSKATINGVVHKCYDTYVANTLTATQQQALINAVNTVKVMNRTGMNTVQVANLIYKTAFGVDNIFGEQVDSLGKLIGNYTGDSSHQNVGVFNDTTYWSDLSVVSLMDSNPSKAAMMVAPGMYGGRMVYSSNTAGETYTRYLNLADNTLRSRYFWEKDLVVGDLFFLKSVSATYLYLYVGNNTLVNLVNMNTYPADEWLQRTPDSRWQYYAVLRPSIVHDSI